MPSSDSSHTEIYTSHILIKWSEKQVNRRMEVGACANLLHEVITSVGLLDGPALGVRE